MSIFGKKKPNAAVTDQIEEQKRISDETLEYVKEVLARKDELLAEAVNQTGGAVRRRRAPA